MSGSVAPAIRAPERRHVSPRGRSTPPAWERRAPWVALVLLISWLTPAGSTPRSLLVVCTDEPEGLAVLQRLDGWMSTARIQGERQEACAATRPGYRGTFLRKNGVVIFLLRNEVGETLEQAIPWLGANDAPLVTVERQGKLPQLSLLLEALLAEERLGLAIPPPVEEPTPRAEGPAPQRRNPPRKLPKPPAPRVPLPTEAPDQVAAEEAPAAERGLDEVDQEEPFVDPEDPPDASGSGEVGEVFGLEEPTGDEPPDEGQAEAPPNGQAPREPGPIFGAPTKRPWRKDAAVGIATRYRSPDFLAAELGLSGSLGPFYAQAGLQLPASWRIAERPLRIASLGGGAGVQQRVPVGGSELRLRAGLSLEWIEVERLDLPWATPHRHWDFGVGLGMEWRTRLFGTWTGLAVEGGGMPTARTIRLPEGPHASLGRAWARLGLRLGWDL